MGTLTFLVSDQQREWMSLGKFFFEEDILRKLKRKSEADFKACAIDYFLANDFNYSESLSDSSVMAETLWSWCKAHPDWRFLTDTEDDFDDIYLAEDEEDAKEYVEEFGDDDSEVGDKIYKKTGYLFSDVEDNDDRDRGEAGFDDDDDEEDL